MALKVGKNRKLFGLLSLFLVLMLYLPMIIASAQVQNPKIRDRPIFASRNGNTFTINTDLFTVRFAGIRGQVPKFQFWYNTTDRNKTVYQVFFHQLFEFNDTTEDGAYNATQDIKEQTFALPSANLSLVGPEDIIDDATGDVIGVRFNFTITGQKGGGQPEANITLQCSLYNETQTVLVAGENKYNVTGSAELKIDIIIESWPFKDDDNLLCLWWSINQQNATREPTISDTSITFGRGYLSWIDEATVDGETVDVTGSFNMTGRTANVYLSYPNFKDKSLIHDPSIGVISIPIPENITSLDELLDYSYLIPLNFNATILANRSTALLFQNLALIVNSSKNLELNITAGTDIVMHNIMLSLEPSESLSLNVDVAVSPPTDITLLDNDINFYLSVEPNETVTLEATLGLYINKTALEETLGREINVSRLTWVYWNGSNWVPVPSLIDVNGYLVANTTHFSTWTIVEIIPLRVAAQLSAETVTQGEVVTISATVKDDANNPIVGAIVKAKIGDMTITLSDQGDGNYRGTLETSELGEGTHDVVVTAEKDGYLLDTDILSLTIQMAMQWITYALISLIVAAVAITGAIVLKRRR